MTDKPNDSIAHDIPSAMKSHPARFLGCRDTISAPVLTQISNRIVETMLDTPTAVGSLMEPSAMLCWMWASTDGPSAMVGSPTTYGSVRWMPPIGCESRKPATTKTTVAASKPAAVRRTAVSLIAAIPPGCDPRPGP